MAWFSPALSIQPSCTVTVSSRQHTKVIRTDANVRPSRLDALAVISEAERDNADYWREKAESEYYARMILLHFFSGFQRAAEHLKI